MAYVTLITGASSGLGREFARLAARDGHTLCLVARRRERLDELAAELRAKHNATVHVVADDLSDAGAPARIHRAVSALGLDVDVLVNNAGVGSSGRFDQLDLGRELAQVQLNVSSLVHLTGLCLPGMVSRGRGRVLNVGSTAGFQPGPGMATYYATKAFVNAWSEAVAYELQGTGATLTVSCPGATESEFADVAGTRSSKLFQSQKPATAESVAGEAWDAMLRGERMVIHGFRNRLGVQSLRAAPRAVVLGIAAKINRP